MRIPALAFLDQESLKRAVHRHRPRSAAGIQERLFTLMFSGLVYPQIWEDPAVDLEALQLGADSDLITIASGGCNVLAYLTANPRSVTAVDLNRSHVALTRLKLLSAMHLPDHGAFFRFFGNAETADNVIAYDRCLRRHLDDESRGYWDGPDWRGRRRIEAFARGFYREGLLGLCIGMGHRVAKLYGVDPAELLRARSMDQQVELFGKRLAPLFRKRLVRWAMGQRVSLYGLGIPPAQYDALAGCTERGMADLVAERLKKLACGHVLRENYFAWQAFARRYPAPGEGPLPLYLQPEKFETIRERAGRAEVLHASLTEHLAAQPAGRFDRYVLLDAQDWMTPEQLNALWAEITRTARAGARVIFRTAGIESVLSGAVSPDVLARWRYEAEVSAELARRDRSAIYGGFHLYALRD